MKQAIFTDANQYLRFYDSNSREFKKLLKAVEEVNESIFITKQIKDEVERRKLGVFISTFADYIRDLKVNKVSLPEHLEADADKKIKEWNKVVDSLEQKTNEQKKELKTIAKELIEKITSGSDEVSQTLSKLFLKCQIASNDHFLSAKKRKELGNPPGKRSDPIGDQLSWEQLLSEANSIDELWIISNDGDYIYEFENEYYLNPFLISELREKNKNIKINCFRTLADGLRSFNKSKKIENLPSGGELDKIKKEEEKLNEIQEFASAIHGYSGYSGYMSATGSTGPTGYTGSGPISAMPGHYASNRGFPSESGSVGPVINESEVVKKAVEILRDQINKKDK